MKRIIVACGSGVATSTVANQKITTYLNEHGYSGQFKIEQCQVSELAEKSKDADFAVATTVVNKGSINCPVLPGISLLTGMGLDKLFQSIEEEMKK